MGPIDKTRFESRGGNGCSNSDYVAGRTTCCGGFVVEDVEILALYFDPGDLGGKTELYASELPCPLCGARQWEIEEVTESAEVPAAWQWAVRPDGADAPK